MKTYLFKFTIVSKDDTWSCDGYTNRLMVITADNVKAAVLRFRDYLDDLTFSVSETAVRKAQKMYRDMDGDAGEPGKKHVQIGYVFNASAQICYGTIWRKKYAEVWTEISECVNPFNN